MGFFPWFFQQGVGNLWLRSGWLGGRSDLPETLFRTTEEKHRDTFNINMNICINI